MNANQEYALSFLPGEVELSQREILHYLGCRGEPDAQLSALIAECTAEFMPAVSYKTCFRRLPIKADGDMLDLGFAAVKSKNLSKNLHGCSEVILIAATCGTGVDRLIQRYTAVSPAKALIFQAFGAAAIEGFMDFLNLRFKDEFKDENLFLRPRFSPGYGDFDLSHQRDIIRFLDTPRKIGLSLTESLLMTPTKSVTAIIGVSETDTKCILSGCEACDKFDCTFRRL